MVNKGSVEKQTVNTQHNTQCNQSITETKNVKTTSSRSDSNTLQEDETSK